MKKIAYISYMKLTVIVISLILTFQISPKVFANDRNSSKEGYTVYYIETAEDFNNIRTTPSAIYILLNDIDLDQYQNWEPISNFSGILDGRGNTIKGLEINRGLQTNKELGNLGLFGQNTGTIKHLTVENPKINCKGAMAGTTNIGVIAGKNLGLIQDVFVQNVKVDLKDNALLGTVVGGLVGENTGTIECCHVTGKTKGKIVGGLVGKNGVKRKGLLGIIKSSSYVGIVESIDYIGGLVGNNMGKIENCFSQACFRVSSGQKAYYVGGIAGDNIGDVNYCYASVWIEEGNKRIQGKISGVAPVGKDYLKGTLFYDKDMMGLIPNTESGEGKSTAQMKLIETYVEAGWNFDSIWRIVDRENYPSFRETGDVEEPEDPGESGDLEDVEDPGESDNPGDTEDPGESGNPQNPGDTGKQDKQEELEDLENPDETEDEGTLEGDDRGKTIEGSKQPEKSDPPQQENIKRLKSQRQSSAVRLEEPQLVESEKELTSCVINPKNIHLKYLREVLVRYYLSKAASQKLKPSKPFGILTWISKYHILKE